MEMEGANKRRRLSANAWREVLARFTASGESVALLRGSVRGLVRG
jgi:hypothetical protein